MAEIAGLKLIVPSSVSAASGTIAVSASGKVTFTTAGTVSVNGCFSATHDNYLVVFRGLSSSGASLELYLRASGSDATGSNYVWQRLTADSTSVSGERQSSQSVTRIGVVDTTNYSGFHAYFYGPNLAQPTAARSVTAGANSGALIQDFATTHSLSTAYDGFTLRREGGGAATLTGALTVYGLSQ